MNLREVAERLGVHYQTVYRAVRSGELVAVRNGRQYDVSEAALERYVKSTQVADVEPRPAMLERGSDELEQLRLIASASRFSAQGCFDEAALVLARAGGDAVAIHTISDDGTSLSTVAAAVRPIEQRALLLPEVVDRPFDASALPWSDVVAHGRLIHDTSITEEFAEALRGRWQVPDMPTPRSHTTAPVVAFDRVVAVVGVAVMTDGDRPGLVENVEAVSEICGVAVETAERFTTAFEAAARTASRLDEMGREAGNSAAVEAGLPSGTTPTAIFDASGGLVAAHESLRQARDADVVGVAALAELVNEAIRSGEDLHQGHPAGQSDVPVIVRLVRGDDDQPLFAVAVCAPSTPG